jgi:hypothetical protein
MGSQAWAVVMPGPNGSGLPSIAQTNEEGRGRITGIIQLLEVDHLVRGSTTLNQLILLTFISRYSYVIMLY